MYDLPLCCGPLAVLLNVEVPASGAFPAALLRCAPTATWDWVGHGHLPLRGMLSIYGLFAAVENSWWKFTFLDVNFLVREEVNCSSSKNITLGGPWFLALYPQFFVQFFFKTLLLLCFLNGGLEFYTFFSELSIINWRFRRELFLEHIWNISRGWETFFGKYLEKFKRLEVQKFFQLEVEIKKFPESRDSPNVTGNVWGEEIVRLKLWKGPRILLERHTTMTWLIPKERFYLSTHHAGSFTFTTSRHLWFLNN